MRLDPHVLDWAAERMRDIAQARTDWRITARLGMNPRHGRYVRTWIGPRLVYLGENRRWLDCRNWILARPKPLCSPAPVKSAERDWPWRVKLRVRMAGLVRNPSF